MDSPRLRAALIALAVLYGAIAVYVLVDDLRHRRALTGRWARFDQALSDVEERINLERLRGEGGEAGS